MVDFNDISGILKTVYSDAEVENIQNMEAATWSKMPKSGKKPTGLGFQASVNLQGNQRGQGSQNELEALRTPGKQVPVKPLIQNKVFTHTIRYSGLSLEVSTSDEDSFIDNVTFQTSEGIADAAKELNAQVYRDGTGRLADVDGAVVAGTTVTFDNGVPTHFREGMYVDIFLGAVEEDSVEVTSVDIENNTIELGSAVTVTDNAEIYRENVNDNAPTDGKELSGLKLLVDDGTISSIYQNVDRTVYPKYNGITLDAGGANVSDDLLQRAKSRVKVIAGKDVDMVCSNTSQFRKYLSILTPAKEYQKHDAKMDSGYIPVPTWNGLPWVVDTDCDFDRIYMLKKSNWKRFDTYDLRLDDKTGSTFRWDNGFDAFISVIKHYGNTGVEGGPNNHVAIDNLAVPTF